MVGIVEAEQIEAIVGEAGDVFGKSFEFVQPTTYAFPTASTAMAFACSPPVPPSHVAYEITGSTVSARETS